MRGNKRLLIIGLFTLLVILVGLAAEGLNTYYLHVVNLALINVILAVGLNFVLGYGGQISFAQAAFFGVGAYTYSILDLYNIPLLISALLAIAVSGAVGFLLGWPALKLKGHYLALATLGFGVIMEELMTNLPITGGANGLTGIPSFHIGDFQFNSDNSLFWVLLVVVITLVLVSVLFNKSPLGARATALRDDETAADLLGVNVRFIKILLFVISAIYGGIAGVLYAGLLGYISPGVFAWSTTFNYLLMIVIGGMGSNSGAVIGAFLFTFLPEWLRFLKGSYMAIFGLAVVLFMIAAPEGIAGFAVNWIKRLTQVMFKSKTNSSDTPTASGGE